MDEEKENVFNLKELHGLEIKIIYHAFFKKK